MTFRASFAVPLCLAALSACGPAAPTPKQPEVLASASSGATTVEVLTLAPLAVGQNTLFYAVTVDGQPVTGAELVQKPLMTMTTMKHGCPVVNPARDADADGRFVGTVVFSMPSSDMETWDLDLEVTPHGAATATTVSFPKLAVAASQAKKNVTVGAETWMVTLGFADGAPKVGSNAYTVSVHKPENAMKMRFLPVGDLTIVATPEMPSMGHGSSGNVNPTPAGDGLYTGTANFSMAGDWVLHLDFRANDTSVGTADYAFDL